MCTWDKHSIGASYQPNMPRNYWMNLWVACDGGSTYARLQVHTWKPADGTPERKQGIRVEFERTEGLEG